jgi:hypothetical protein
MTTGPAVDSRSSSFSVGSGSGSASHHHHHHNAVAVGLAFADVSSDLLQLRPFDVNQVNQVNSTETSKSDKISATTLSATSPNPFHVTASVQSAAPPIQPRKPSPGLAARLKALGFGSSTKKSTSPPPPAQGERVGRLSESQLRALDQNHQISSTHIVERRGRPWKGAGATFTFPSRSAVETVQAATAVAGDESGLQDTTASTATTARPTSTYLPEITASEPLDMDTHKYRLPDHTNGNGTKVQLDTRREHLERGMRPLSPDDIPPPPLPKDSPPPNQTEFVPDLKSYFTPGHHRPGSIYTLSRASFANQLAQLTSLQLPDAESLSSRVSAIPTAQAAVRALINAAEQIRSWVSKASEVIDGLDSDDDVEWAAAGGREGLAEVESAITRFEELVNVYVGAIEDLQRRADYTSVAAQDLTKAVAQMESIMGEWKKIRATLTSVKEQVEIAMEWEELWNMVLGDIQGEMDELRRLVFEMEERRHKSLMAVASGEGVDIGDLETIVEETPPSQVRLHAQNRFSLPAFPLSPSSPGAPTMSQDDGSLLALFARMQPLRASLDFLPMRLSVFEARAQEAFPTACEELTMRRMALDGNYKKLEKDAESLRKELGEDRWVLAFHNAGRQAQKMYESVERAVAKLREAIDSGTHLTNPAAMTKKVEGYDQKKTHYGPAIERILMIIDKGVKERLTVNGEILRLHADLTAKWEALKEQMRETDVILEEIQSDKKGQQLRDSISSMLSNDRSTIGSGHETPGSSPPSSVIMTSLGLETPTAKAAKHRSASLSSHLPQPSNRRHSSMPMPTPTSHLPKRTAAGSRLSMLGRQASDITPMASKIQRPGSTVGGRPRWNTSTNTNFVDTGHNFKPLSLTTPSQYKRTPMTQRSASSITPTSSGSKLPTFRSPLTRESSASPMPEDTPSRPSGSRMSFRDRIGSPGPYSQQALSKPRLATQASMSALGNRRASLQPAQPKENGEESQSQPSRPASSLASSARRISMLPQPRSKKEAAGPSGITGRESPQAIAGARVAMRKNSSSTSDSSKGKDNKPRWRG